MKDELTYGHDENQSKTHRDLHLRYSFTNEFSRVTNCKGPIIIIKTACFIDFSAFFWVTSSEGLHEHGWPVWPGTNYNTQSRDFLQYIYKMFKDLIINLPCLMSLKPFPVAIS